MSIEKSALDNHLINNHLKKPLILEIKEFRNVSQPFQRTLEIDEDEGKITSGGIKKKKDQTYLLKAHDGKRIVKIVLLFEN